MGFDKEYAMYYDLFNQGKDYTKECNFLEEVFNKFSQFKIKKILDLGCGTGHHAQELIKRGYDVTGLDLSNEMIEIAKIRNPDGKFIFGDMSNYLLNEKFDAVICMFSALGYLTDNKKIESFFECCKNHLKENGLLILDVWNGLGVMNELPSSREKIVEREGLKIIRTSFPNLDAKNHINNVKFEVKVYEKINNNKVIGNDIQDERNDVKSSKRSFSSDNLIDAKINKKFDIKDNENEKLIATYEENHKVRFFFPLELKKYMEVSGFHLLHLCPSYEIDKELSEKYWNMVVVGKITRE